MALVRSQFLSFSVLTRIELSSLKQNNNNGIKKTHNDRTSKKALNRKIFPCSLRWVYSAHFLSDFIIIRGLKVQYNFSVGLMKIMAVAMEFYKRKSNLRSALRNTYYSDTACSLKYAHRTLHYGQQQHIHTSSTQSEIVYILCANSGAKIFYVNELCNIQIAHF